MQMRSSRVARVSKLGNDLALLNYIPFFHAERAALKMREITKLAIAVIDDDLIAAGYLRKLAEL